MKTILVTGGAGYIGSHTVVALHEAGYRPVLIDNFENSNPSVIDRLRELTTPDLTFYEGDILNTSFLRDVWESEKPDAVIHFAAKKAVGESVEKPLAYYRSNIDGLLSVLEIMQANDCSKIVFSSSCTVYGEPDECPVTESTVQKPATSPYGATKQMCERILEDVSKTGTVHVIALRYFNPVGAHPSAKIGELPNGTPNNLIPYLTQTAAGLREKLTVFGNDYDTPDGTCMRDFIHVMDLAEAHVAAIKSLEAQPAGFTAINVGTGKGNSVKEVIETFEKVTGVPIPHEYGPRRAGDVVRIWSDVTLSKHLLNWEAKRTIEDSLKDAWNWQESLKKEV